MLRYKFGTNAETDSRCSQLTQGNLKRNWVLEIRERAVSQSNCDDLYWFVKRQGKTTVYRSINELRTAKLI